MAPRPALLIAMHPALTQGMVRESHLERLRACTELLSSDSQPSLADDSIADLLARTEILLTGWGCPPIDEALLVRAPKLRAILHSAGTVKNIVTPACWQRGIAVSTAASANAVPVAEYTLAAILLANKAAFALQREYREARHMKRWIQDHPAIGNYRKRIGLIGASRVGRRVVELLAPFDFDVAVSDPTLSEAEVRALGKGVEAMQLDGLLAWADVASLHAPLLPATRGLIDARRLALLRDGATFINTARGAIVDGSALEAELVSGRISAVIDTTDPEQLPAESPLYDLPNVFLTPHIAGAMGSETQRLMDLAIDEVERFARGEGLEYALSESEMEFTA